MFTPNRGISAELLVSNYGSTWGGDDEFWRYRGNIKLFHDLLPKLIVGLRADAEGIDGEAPFYSYPYVNLRGIRALRYQGEQTLVGEVELRWNMTPRWSLLGFGGAGKAFGDGYEFSDSDTVYTKGLGLRYFLARLFGLRAGFDVAWGPEETAYYLQVGYAWSY